MTWAPPALPPRLFYTIPVGAARLRASCMPGRSGFVCGVAVQAVGMGRIDAEDLHLVEEERKVLQRQRHVAVLGVALDVGMEPGGDEIPPLERGTPI